MSIFSNKSLVLVLMLAALCMSGRSAHAQAAPVPYWNSNLLASFGDNLSVGQSSNTYGSFASVGGGDSDAPSNFSGGWFIGSEGGALGSGLSMSGVSQYGAFGNFGSLHYQGTQFGYDFQKSGLPLKFYGGVDTFKYNPGGGAFGAFDSTSGTLPGYGAHAGVEFRPTSNLSLSFGASFSQTSSGRVDSDINSPLLPGQSPLFFGGHH